MDTSTRGGFAALGAIALFVAAFFVGGGLATSADVNDVTIELDPAAEEATDDGFESETLDDLFGDDVFNDDLFGGDIDLDDLFDGDIDVEDLLNDPEALFEDLLGPGAGSELFGPGSPLEGLLEPGVDGAPFSGFLDPNAEFDPGQLFEDLLGPEFDSELFGPGTPFDGFLEGDVDPEQLWNDLFGGQDPFSGDPFGTDPNFDFDDFFGQSDDGFDEDF